jgi:hypothetical protein
MASFYLSPLFKEHSHSGMLESGLQCVHSGVLDSGGLDSGGLDSGRAGFWEGLDSGRLDSGGTGFWGGLWRVLDLAHNSWHH